MNFETMTDRELDDRLDEVLMRLTKSPLWYPSKNIQDAFEVVEAMRERGCQWQIDTVGEKHWSAECRGYGKAIDKYGLKQAESLPRAICIAALRACE